ncbi:short chain dehydrogenase [Xylariomycetidae sp. FL0641]|nr:short chain dehydrogenase [Xylariomycetidae sp. FL0641]
MAFPYKTVLMVGCTAGIGLALAERMIANGVFVIAVGRRKERLDDFVAKHGPGKAAASQFDITDLDGIRAWSESLVKTYPSLDCVVLNSGLQRPLNFAKPEAIDLKTVHAEFTTNYTSYITMIKYFLPHLQSLHGQKPAALVAVSSGLGLVPMPRCANYSATKAALHSLMWSIRAQLGHDEQSNHIRVIEIIPPAVKTELHELQDDLRAKGNTDFGLTLDEFMREAWAGLVNGDEEIPVGPARTSSEAFEALRRKGFKAMVAMTMESA